MKKVVKSLSQKFVAVFLTFSICMMSPVMAFADSSGSSSTDESTESSSSSASTEVESAIESASSQNDAVSSGEDTESSSQGEDAKGNGLFVDLDGIIVELGTQADTTTVQAYLSQLLKDAVDANFNTIYLDTWRGGLASWYSDTLPTKDPYGASMFDYIIQVAEKRGLEVVLWIDPMWQGNAPFVGSEYASGFTSSKTPQYFDISNETGYLNAINELHALLDSTARYENVKGILLETEVSASDTVTEPYTDDAEAPRYRFTKQVGEIAKERDLTFGVLNTGFYGSREGVGKNDGKGYGTSVEDWKTPVMDWINGVGAGYFMPGLNADMGVAGGQTYIEGELVNSPNFIERLSFCASLFEDSDFVWKPVVMQPKNCDQYEMTSQVMLMQNLAKNGFGYSDYTRLKNGADDLVSRVSELLSDRELRDLSIDPTFRITRPSIDTTLYTSTYYIMGIADPDQTLTITIEDEEAVAVTDRGSNGTFGYYVTLDLGANTFTFTQGEEERTVVITREKTAATGETAAKAIGVITQSSMAPTYDTPIFAAEGTTVSLSCTGPSGATISAQVEGRTVKLSQTASADEGIATKFGGSTKLQNTYSSTKVEELGAITYTLEWNGTTKTFTSTGGYYVVGSDADFYVEAGDILIPTYETPASAGNSDYIYYGVMNIGTIARVNLDTEEDTGNTYALFGGGYVLKSKVNIVATNKLASTRNEEGNFAVSDITYRAEGTTETFRFKGAGHAPFLFTNSSKDGTEVSLYNVDSDTTAQNKMTAYTEKFSVLTLNAERLTIRKTTVDDTPAITIKLTCYGNLQGYDVQYDGEDTLVSFHYNTSLSADDESQPLKGQVILLDPGHGGSDGGAPSPAQEWGPTEKDVTIQLAHRVRDQLEALGATVYLTREYDVRVELYDRAALFEKLRPDYFISIHLNSLNEDKDAGSVDGAMVFYYNDYSEGFGEDILEQVCYRTSRDNNGVQDGAYVVVRPTTAPAVLCELGFLPNPVEYSNMLTEDDLNKTATGVVEGLENYRKSSTSSSTTSSTTTSTK